MKLNSQEDKKIGIFGLGITGISVYKALTGVAKKILCWDDLQKNIDQFTVKFGDQEILSITDVAWSKLDKIIISPGVPKNHRIFLLAEQFDIQISSDVELFYEENPNSEFIVITGTNGKSTTTAMVGHILNEAGLDYAVGGNIGIPVLSLPYDKKGYIFELSSFQIGLLSHFAPTITALLNITPDHLDYHGTFEEYTKVKNSMLLRGGIRIITIDSQITADTFRRLKNIGESNLIPISSVNLIKDGISFFDDQITDNFFDKKYYSPVINHNLLGKHNRENIAVAFAICRAIGLNAQKIISSIIEFQGLNHRMQYLGVKNGIRFYNDSKATNVSSTIVSLGLLNNIFWIAGGRFKEETLDPLDAVIEKVAKAYVFGENKEIFSKYLENKVPHETHNTMEEALIAAKKDASNSHEEASILLAPAAASTDQFKNSEERGELFIKLVNSIE